MVRELRGRDALGHETVRTEPMMGEDAGKPRKKRVCPRCREEHMVSAYARQRGGTPPDAQERAKKSTSWYPVGWYCPNCAHFIPRPAPTKEEAGAAPG